MKDLENEYKRRFSEETLANDDFDVDGLWEDISSELHEGDKAPFGYIWKSGLLLLVLLLGSGLMYQWYTANQKEVQNSNVAAVENVNETNSDSSLESEIAEKLEIEEIKTEDKLLQNSKIISTSSSEVANKKLSKERNKNQNYEQNKDQVINESEQAESPNTYEDNSILDLAQGNDLQSVRAFDSQEFETALDENVKDANISSDPRAGNDSAKGKSNVRDSEVMQFDQNAERNDEKGLRNILYQSYPLAESSQKSPEGNPDQKLSSQQSPPQKNPEVEKKPVQENEAAEEIAGILVPPILEDGDAELWNDVLGIPLTNGKGGNENLKENADGVFDESQSVSALEELQINKTLNNPKAKSMDSKKAKPIRLPRDLQLNTYAQLLFGINATDLNYSNSISSELADLKSGNELWDSGAQWALEVGIRWKNKYLLETGLEYQQAYSKFEYEQTTDLLVEKQNQLLKVWLYESTNDTINVLYGDTTVAARSTRRVVHHNKLQQWSIPIAVGLDWQKGAFAYGFTLGPSFNFTRAQSGRYINEEEAIIDFDESSAQKPLNDFQLGWHLSPHIRYSFSKRYYLVSQMRYAVQNHKNAFGENWTTRWNQISGSIGVGLSF